MVVREQQVFVADQQRLEQRPEELSVAVRELAGVDEFDRFVQLGIRLVQGTRPVSRGLR